MNQQPPQPGSAYSANYAEYYQQYMQYYYTMNMYGNYQSAYSNAAQTVPPPPPPPDSSTEASQQQAAAKQAAIKINLKFHQQQQQQQQQQQPKLLVPQIKESPSQQPIRKSRFDTTSTGSTSNVVKQQSLYQQYQQKQREKLAAATPPPSKPVTVTTTSSSSTATAATSSANDIISDINKWPISLKNYCSRLFQIYHSNKLVSEQQVTRYLQMRITEAFKIKADLNINWDTEKIPDVQTIREFLAQQDLQQKKEQQKVVYNQVAPPPSLLSMRLKPPSAAFQQQQRLNQQQQVSNNKRKSKSPSSDKSSESSSSSSVSETITNSHKKLKKEQQQPRVVSSKLRRNLSEEDEEEEFDEEEEAAGYESESEDERMSEEDFKPLSKRQQKLKNKQKKQHNTTNARVLNQRSQRFHVQVKNEPFKRKINRTISLFEKGSITDLSQTRVIGTSQDLEKEYLRLTGAPEPSNVRPLNVLKKSLDYILEKYAKSGDYRYACDQLKAIRQDLTVQMIRNEFTILVYETHARIAIQKSDRDELNQCQSQLMNLYETVQDKKATENAPEFIGYRLLYYMLTKSYKDLNRVIIEIKRKYKEIDYLKHLLKFRLAWHMNNFVMLFKLYKKSNQMSKYLIDLFIERERKTALKMIIKAYRPTIKLDTIKELLAYESINKCKEDLLTYGLSITSQTDTEQQQQQQRHHSYLVLDCKSSNIQNL